MHEMPLGDRMFNRVSMIVRLKKYLFELWPLSCFVMRHGPRELPQVALTFDDGPHPDVTPLVLDCLAQHKATATFFVLGCQIKGRRRLVERALKEGHQIALHGYTHGTCLATQHISACRCNGVLGLINPLYYRPPRGRLSPLDLIWAAFRRARIVLWSQDTHDSMRLEGKWKGAPFEPDNVTAGDVVLMHDDNEQCLVDLAELLRSMNRRGLQAVSVSSLSHDIQHSV